MAFRKAESKQAFLKLGVYGPTGSGKTFSSLLLAEGLAKHCGKRIAYIDTESGTDFYAQEIPARPLHPKAFDFDRIVTKSLSQSNLEVGGINAECHGVVVVDSITHLWEAAIEGWSGNRTSADTIPMHAWGTIKKPYKALITALLNGQYHAIICGRQKNVFGDDEATGEIKLLGVAMKAEGETAYEPHVLFRMIREIGRGKALAPVAAFVEKDRTGILAGKTIHLPADQKPGFTFEQLGAPLLAVMSGSAQPQVETVEEASTKDAEAAAEELVRMRHASAETVREFTARFQLCNTPDEVEAISKEITAALKKTLTKQSVTDLRNAYRENATRVKGAAA